MEWIFLVIAGGLEVFWSTCMKYSEGFTDLKFSILTVVGMIFSFLFLSQATKSLPLGTAYAVWTGIGALGAVIVGIVTVQRAGHSGEDLLCGAAADRDRGAEGDVRTLRRMSQEISAQMKALKKMGLFPLML